MPLYRLQIEIFKPCSSLILPAAKFYIDVVSVKKIFQETSAQFMNKMHSNATHSFNCSAKKQSDWKRPSITRCVYLYTTGWKFACQGETDVKLPSHIMGVTVSCARARVLCKAQLLKFATNYYYCARCHISMACNSGWFSLIILADIRHYAKWLINHAPIIYIQMWVCIIMQRELLFHHDLKCRVRRKSQDTLLNGYWKQPESFVPIVSVIKTYAFLACILNNQHIRMKIN